MKTTSAIVMASVLASAALIGGCVKANVRVPDRFTFGGDDRNGESAAPSQIPAAEPVAPVDLQRENAQLRQRVAELNKQLDRANDKIDDLEEKVHDLRKDLKKVERQRDRYKDAMDD